MRTTIIREAAMQDPKMKTGRCFLFDHLIFISLFFQSGIMEAQQMLNKY